MVGHQQQAGMAKPKVPEHAAMQGGPTRKVALLSVQGKAGTGQGFGGLGLGALVGQQQHADVPKPKVPPPPL